MRNWRVLSGNGHGAPQSREARAADRFQLLWFNREHLPRSLQGIYASIERMLLHRPRPLAALLSVAIGSALALHLDDLFELLDLIFDLA